MSEKIRICTESILYVVVDTKKNEVVYYDGSHYKLSFSLAYELYKKDTENREMYRSIGRMSDGTWMIERLRKDEIENDRIALNNELKKFMDSDGIYNDFKIRR